VFRVAWALLGRDGEQDRAQVRSHGQRFSFAVSLQHWRNITQTGALAFHHQQAVGRLSVQPVDYGIFKLSILRHAPTS